MRVSIRWLSGAALAACTLAVLGASGSSTPYWDEPREFREYPSFEGAAAAAEMPRDALVPGELVVGRLMYPSAGGRRGDWHYGNTGWTDDYPRGDRALIQMLRRNTRVNVRAVEQPVSLDDGDDIFHWPFLVAGLAFSWSLPEEQARKLHDYLERGGFLFCDSYFGQNNWELFAESLRRVFPDRRIEDLTDDEAVFHIAFDLPHMTDVQIPNYDLNMGRGLKPHWRGVFDDQRRLMVLIAHNNDVADGWQWADDTSYPADEANRALRIGSNVAIYAMTH